MYCTVPCIFLNIRIHFFFYFVQPLIYIFLMIIEDICMVLLTTAVFEAMSSIQITLDSSNNGWGHFCNCTIQLDYRI